MFSLRYEAIEQDYGYIHIIVNGQNLSEYLYNGTVCYCICRISSLSDWIKSNSEYIFSDDPFPIMTTAETGADMWFDSDNYIPENLDDSIPLLEKRQDWIWHHSIDICKDEFCMPFVVIRKVGDNIELSWNNIDHNYEGVDFRYKHGVCYLDMEKFRAELYNLMEE